MFEKKKIYRTKPLDSFKENIKDALEEERKFFSNKNAKINPKLKKNFSKSSKKFEGSLKKKFRL